MDNFFISSDNILVGEGDSALIGQDSILSASESIVGPQGPPGPAGRDGRDGVDGQSATVTVGETTTTAPGTDAVVTNVGDNLNAVLNFSIPRGAVGETGPAGVDGVDGVDGSDGFSPIASVEQTEYGAEITITDSNGTTSAQVVNGSQGTPGQAATITVGSTSTGAAGTNASVTNSGTSSAAVLDFVIPRGADGQNGTNGNDGFSPIATVTQNTGSATISITDSQGTTTATVYDGTPGTVPNDGTLTIQKNGTTVQTFTANQSSNATANITVPTQFSDLSGSITSSQIDWSSVDYNDIPKSKAIFGNNADSNSYNTSGLYYLTGVTVNAPDSGGIYLAIIIMNPDADYGMQIFSSLWTSNTWIRNKQGGTWGSWRTINIV